MTKTKIEDPIKTDKKRKPGTFKPGEVHNPKGAPKKDQAFSKIARKLLGSKKINLSFEIEATDQHGILKVSKKKLKVKTSGPDFYHALISIMIMKGMKGDNKSITELINRTQGTPLQEIEQIHSGNLTVTHPLFDK